MTTEILCLETERNFLETDAQLDPGDENDYGEL